MTDLAPLWVLCSLNDDTLKESTPSDFAFEYVDISNVTEGDISDDLESLTFGTAPSRARRLAQPDDVIISTVRTYLRAIARVGAAEFQRVYSTGFAVLRPVEGAVDPRYLAYILTSNRVMDEIIATSVGVSYPAIQGSALHRMRVPRADLDTQRAIADYLDRETGEIDAMIAKMDELAETLRIRRRALILGVLTSMSSRIRLTLALDVVSGSGFPDKYQGLTGEELPFYKVSSLSTAENGRLDEAENAVSRVVAAELHARIVPPGSVVMAKIGAALLLARYALTTRPACIDNNMQALVPREGVVDSRFLAYAMEEVSIHSLVKPGPVPSLDVMGMKMTEIAYDPSLEEQRRIADHLDEVTGKIDAMLAKVAELKSLLIERRAALITDVVTGRKAVA